MPKSNQKPPSQHVLSAAAASAALSIMAKRLGFEGANVLPEDFAGIAQELGELPRFLASPDRYRKSLSRIFDTYVTRDESEPEARSLDLSLALRAVESTLRVLSSRDPSAVAREVMLSGLYAGMAIGSMRGFEELQALEVEALSKVQSMRAKKGAAKRPANLVKPQIEALYREWQQGTGERYRSNAAFARAMAQKFNDAVSPKHITDAWLPTWRKALTEKTAK